MGLDLVTAPRASDRSQDYDSSVISRPRFPEDPTRFEAVDWATAEALRKMTPQERLQLTFEAMTSLRNMLLSHLRAIHPSWDDEALEREFARRMGIVT